MIANILGFLTQFLFIIYAAILFVGYCIILVRAHRWRAVLSYFVVSLASGVICIALYPALVDMILVGDMATDVRTNLGTLYDFADKLIIFGYHLSKALFGSSILFIVLLSAMIVFKLQRLLIQRDREWQLIKYQKQYFLDLKDNENSFFWLVCSITAFAFLILIKIAPFNEGHRYIAYLYPNIVLISVFTGYLSLRKKMNVAKARKLLIGIVCAITVLSYFNHGVDYLYAHKSNQLNATILQFSSYNAYGVVNNRHDMTIAMPLLMMHDNSCYISATMISTQFKIMQTKAEKELDPILVYFPDWVENLSPNTKALDQILSSSNYKKYTLLFSGAESGLATSIYLFE
jgi:hypothetical protein